jgi:hypothetical protein
MKKGMVMDTLEYFGKETVEKAVADYFAKHGLNEQVRDDLALMAIQREADFLEMVCAFVENNG